MQQSIRIATWGKVSWIIDIRSCNYHNHVLYICNCMHVAGDAVTVPSCSLRSGPLQAQRILNYSLVVRWNGSLHYNTFLSLGPLSSDHVSWNICAELDTQSCALSSMKESFSRETPWWQHCYRMERSTRNIHLSSARPPAQLNWHLIQGGHTQRYSAVLQPALHVDRRSKRQTMSA